MKEEPQPRGFIPRVLRYPNSRRLFIASLPSDPALTEELWDERHIAEQRGTGADRGVDAVMGGRSLDFSREATQNA